MTCGGVGVPTPFLSVWTRPDRGRWVDRKDDNSALIAFASGAAPPGTAVWDIRLHKAGHGYHVEAELDGPANPRGTVSVGDCEKFSRRLGELLDQEAERSDRNPALPADLRPDNYTIEVSSVGAERELRLPGDLVRFQGEPLRMRYREEGKEKDGTFVFVGPDKNDYVFQVYVPARERRGKKKKEEPAVVRIGAGDLLKVNLYLDF